MDLIQGEFEWCFLEIELFSLFVIRPDPLLVVKDRSFDPLLIVRRPELETDRMVEQPKSIAYEIGGIGWIRMIIHGFKLKCLGIRKGPGDDGERELHSNRPLVVDGGPGLDQYYIFHFKLESSCIHATTPTGHDNVSRLDSQQVKRGIGSSENGRTNDFSFLDL